MEKILVPNIGTSDAVEVIEILVKPGDQVDKDASLIVLESDKASMEVPSPFSGKLGKLFVKEGDKVKEGTPIADISTDEVAGEAERAEVKEEKEKKRSEKDVSLAKVEQPVKTEVIQTETVITELITAQQDSSAIHAGPAVRKLAREFGIDLQQVVPSGPKSRILKEDLQDFVKARLNQATQPMGLMQEASTGVDFSQFGPVEVVPMNKIQRLTADNMLRSWLTAPQVTQFEVADITDLEAFRQQQKDGLLKQGVRLTVLSFVVKVVCYALKKYPEFNVSLQGDRIIRKGYIHIGIAVDTPSGLMVPVIRNADQKSIVELARELQDLTTKAKEKKLLPNQMQGGCFSISSLGNLGGTQFTPLVNTPEVAILGLSKAQAQPVYIDKKLKPRLILPLALSYDHRSVNGAGALRFINAVKHGLEDIKYLLM